MASRRGRIVLVILLIVVVASVWRNVLVERDKRQLAKAYGQAQQMIKELGDERAKLNDELSNARQTVESQASDLSNLGQELKSVQHRLNGTMAELASLQREHEQLRSQHSSLESQLSSMTAEKERLQAKLSSLKDLRLAIRDVTRKIRDQRWAAWRAHLQERLESAKEADRQRFASGNHGYVVREGKSTLGASPRLHVHVLEPQSQ